MKHEGLLETRDGTQIWYGLTCKDKLPVVLTDGIGCDGFIWPYVVDHFADSYSLLRWHYRGHGRSESPPTPQGLSIEDLAEDLHELLQHLGIERAVLAGHSMGVQVILEYYRRHPERVAALVPMCGSYERPADTFHDTDRYRPVFDAAIRLFTTSKVAALLWRHLTPSKLGLHLARIAELNRHLVRAADFMPYLKHLGRMDPEVFFHMLGHAIDHSAKDVLETIDVPTLIIAGDTDKFSPLRCSIHMNRSIPFSQLAVLRGGSHAAPIEMPDEVEAQLEPFLENIARVEGFAAVVQTDKSQ